MDGVLLQAKPAGVTSHDVVAAIRRRLPGRTKVGHAGTLDPFARGLLLILVGRATRAQRFFMELPKTYQAVARLGWTSTTGDRDGELVETGRMPDRLEIPVGPQLQKPPAYSAVKVGGRRAYELARAGETPELGTRPITVYRAELLWHREDRACFEIECSSGTYVRSLVTGLGDAYCEWLSRTAIGPFRLKDAAPAAAVTAADPAAALLPLNEALSFMPERPLSVEEATAVRHGRRISATGPPAEHTRLTHQGEILAIGELRAAESGEGELQPVVVFAPA